MAPTSTARPAKKPARAEVLSRVGKTPVKKTAAKKTVAKKAVKKVAARKPVGRALPTETTTTDSELDVRAPDEPMPQDRRSPAQRAGVGKRLKTIATTTVGADRSKIAAAENAEGTVKASVEPRAPQRAVAKPKSAPRPRRRSAAERIGDLPPGAPLSDRVVSAIEHELTQIENIIGRSRVQPDERTEGERRARTLASLARTLSELKKLRTDEKATRPADDDAASGDIDAVRLDLARRLDVLVVTAKAVHPEPAEGEGP